LSVKTIVRSYRAISASKLVDQAADALTQIKAEDELTDADMGAALGKHSDQAAKYRTGLAEMSMVTFIRACERWNGRFADAVLAKIGMKLVPLEGDEAVDQSTASCITKLLLHLSVALEDGKVDDRELAGMRTALDEAGRAIDAMRAKLGPRAA
jgi:hypothetical protein